MESKESHNAQESTTEPERAPTPKGEHVALTSGDISDSQVVKLRELFPEVFVEGKIDFERLKITLGAAAESGPGRFHFSWAGKDDAVSLLQTPSAGTLVPCPEESINFETTGNVFIEGDNLEVLKLLFKPYFGRVKLIYIDPPYNTGQDFVYPDNYAEPLKTYLQITGQVDAEGNLLTSNPETSGRYHSTWLSMMYPRLFLARQLLKEDGVIFVSIDDHEAHHLRLLMNETFGEENFICCFVWKRRQVSDNRNLDNVSTDHEYIVAYSRGDGSLLGTAKDLTKYDNPDNDPRGPWMSDNLTGLANSEQRPNLHYDIVNPETGQPYPPLASRGWAYDKKSMAKLIEEGRILWPVKPDGRPRLKRFLNEIRSQFTGFSSIQDFGYTTDGTRTIEELFGEKVIQFPKPVAVPRKLGEQTTSSSEGDIVLDFFAGSCTTAQAVLEMNHADGGNRRFICVQLPEPTANKTFSTIAEIGKERIRRVIGNLAKEVQPCLGEGGAPEDLGFKVFKLSKPNIQQWPEGEDRDPEAYVQKLALFNDPLVAGWKPENVIWEVALREGFGLKTQFVLRDLGNGNTVYDVIDPDSEQKFMICLDDKIPIDLSKHCELTLEDLFICRDVALDDSAAANLALQCRLKTI
jgi:adenine-specific DNA-methyltransferase